MAFTRILELDRVKADRVNQLGDEIIEHENLTKAPKNDAEFTGMLKLNSVDIGSAIGQNTSDLNAHELDNVRHINKIPFQCTPNTGFQISYQDSYKIGNLILLQVVISMADGTNIPSSGYILFFPHAPILPYVRVLSAGLDVNGNYMNTAAAVLYAHNKGIHISGMAAGAKTVSVSCVYTTY